ncbi:hypothetical protein QBC47DRAFT_401756 [Echria macrotheca]|uniref:Uncharacterized protein n=1 Tax=Echria macrotheca TaxID=438768 RepID=A0AAJ0BD02_9PEZI|nr:hypothetical protein QBC47DRAFT_401756 [Echria macrotheca]
MDRKQAKLSRRMRQRLRRRMGPADAAQPPVASPASAAASGGIPTAPVTMPAAADTPDPAAHDGHDAPASHVPANIMERLESLEKTVQDLKFENACLKQKLADMERSAKSQAVIAEGNKKLAKTIKRREENIHKGLKGLVYDYETDKAELMDGIKQLVSVDNAQWEHIRKLDACVDYLIDQPPHNGLYWDKGVQMPKRWGKTG